MRTRVGSRSLQGPAQVPTVPEIEETIQGEIAPPTEKIYVAVGKDKCESVHALQWALLNLDNIQAASVILLHIHLPLRYMPSPMGLGKIPLTQATKYALKAYNDDVQNELNNCLKEYLEICTRAEVKAEVLIVEKDDVCKGIVEEVLERGITKLIMGTTSASGAISKKMKTQTPGKADYVRRHAIESCDVSIVCKGKLVLLREGSPVHNVTAQKSNRKRPLSDWLRKRAETTTVKSSPDDFGRSLSSPANFQWDLDASVQTPSKFSVDGDFTPAWVGELSESLEIRAEIHELSSDSEVADSPRIDVDETYSCNNISTEPKGSQEASVYTETLKLQLNEALQVVESAKREVRIETVRRKKEEAAAMKAIHKFKHLEAAFKEATKEKEDATSLLSLTELKCQEMEEKLTSLATKFNQFSRERHEAMQELEQARLMLAATEKQNYRVLQQKDAEVKQLQNCLHSRPRIETPISSTSYNSLVFREYSLEEIKSATCDFSNNFKLGGGGYGTVYKGQIGQRTVAVKILRDDSLQGWQEFQREIDILKDIRHPHLVRVVGAGFERGCIVYEYMANGCLTDRLSCKNSTPPLLWHARIRIAAEFCSALQYLHSFKPDPIVHHDLKPENILLDENYVSKISDFGLAHLLPQNIRSESEPKRTFSYMDPEYLASGEYSTKSDVYSLGIVILQLLTGKPALGLVKEVERALESSKLEQILDASAGEWPLVQASQLAYLALHCTERVRVNRPDLQPAVMKMLDQLRNFAVAASISSRPVERGQNSVQTAEEIHVPSFFLCPILKEVMRDPHVASDGFTYEKEAIQGWFDGGRNTSPMTNIKLCKKNLVANYSLRSAIRQWQERGDLL